VNPGASLQARWIPVSWPQGEDARYRVRDLGASKEVTFSVYFDRIEGLVRCFASVWSWSDERLASAREVQPASRPPFALALQKPGGLGKFSPRTLVVATHWSDRFFEFPGGPAVVLKDEGAGLLVDPSDGTLWTVDPTLPEPIRRVELPNGDRFAGFERLFHASALRYAGYYELRSPLVRGERDVHAWNGEALVPYATVVDTERDRNVVRESEAAARVEFRIVETNRDTLARTIEFRDPKDDHVVFRHRFEPRTSLQRVIAASMYACTLLRPVVLNARAFLNEPPAGTSASNAFTGEPLLGGRARPGLLAANGVLALASMVAAWRLLRSRGASTGLCAASAAMGFLFGPLVLALVWALEPRRRGRPTSQHRTVAVPSPLIESVPT
jgi:hypothetical protein